MSSYDIREIRDAFFTHLRRMWWPEIDENGPPSNERQLELIQRICVERGDKIVLKCSLEQFNSVLTECNQPPVGRSFFEYFFPGFANGVSLGEFIAGTMKFMKIGLWKYGNFRLALRELGQCTELEEELRGMPLDGFGSVPEEAFTERVPFDFMSDLSAEERYALGYASDKSQIDPKVAERSEHIKRIGKQNTQEYLTLDILDVYIATSMREPCEYESFTKLLNDVFKNPDLERLNIRYFDPTIAFSENRIAKGLLEALMLKRAKVTLYVAGEKDTFGKDSECAATLVQGKPVVVYVEEASGERKERLDQRANMFKSIHPLGLQVCHETGVANGVIVVRNPLVCREVLKDILLHHLRVRLDKETESDKITGVGYVLKEDRTGSILRVAADDKVLVRAFENFYFREL